MALGLSSSILLVASALGLSGRGTTTVQLAESGIASVGSAIEHGADSLLEVGQDLLEVFEDPLECLSTLTGAKPIISPR